MTIRPKTEQGHAESEEAEKICINCAFYLAGEEERDDICKHPQARSGGVRSIQHYHCGPMVSGICKNNQLFMALGVSAPQGEAK